MPYVTTAILPIHDHAMRFGCDATDELFASLAAPTDEQIDAACDDAARAFIHAFLSGGDYNEKLAVAISVASGVIARAHELRKRVPRRRGRPARKG